MSNRISPSASDDIRYGTTARDYHEHWNSMSEATQQAQGFADFRGGVTEEERKEIETKRAKHDKS